MENKEFLKTVLEQFKKPIPCTWRVQSYSKNKPIATVMAYIDARDAMDVLDAYATFGWHREHYMVESKVYCKVGIVFPDGSVQWRSDCGTESNQDAEKGQASDSFKRACVNWGIGRFLYDLPIQYVTTNVKKEGNNYPYCVDDQGKQIWDLTKYINSKLPNAPKAPSNPPPPPANTTPPPADDNKPWLNQKTAKWDEVKKALISGYTWDQVLTKLKISKENRAAMDKEVEAAKANPA